MTTFRHLILVVIILFNFPVYGQWDIVHLGVEGSGYIRDIDFANDSTGFALGSGKWPLKTTDGGDSWFALKDSIFNISSAEYKMSVADDNTIFIIRDIYDFDEDISYYNLYKSEDLGASWEEIDFITSTLNTLWFSDKNTGFTSGESFIAKTENGGDSWRSVWSGQKLKLASVIIKHIGFVDSLNGYASLAGIPPINDDREWIFDLLWTDDGGETWDTLGGVDIGIIGTVYFKHKSLGFVHDIRITDEGSKQEMISISEPRPNVTYSFDFVSDSVGIAVGTPFAWLEHDYRTFFISKTIDAGATWTPYDTIGIPLYEVYYKTKDEIFVGGNHQLIMKLTNGVINKLPNDYPWTYGQPTKTIEKYQKEQEYILYPNPAQEFVMIDAKRNSPRINEVKVYDMKGILIRTFSRPTVLDSYNISNFSPGNYLFVLYTNYGLETHMIQIK